MSLLIELVKIAVFVLACYMTAVIALYIAWTLWSAITRDPED